MKNLINFLVSVLIGVVIIAAIAPDKDDSDPENGRSGMTIKVDNLTGCQYLGSYFGLTPRLNRDGSQICND